MSTKTKNKEHSQTLTEEQFLHMYHQMVRIRAFENKVNELYLNAIMPGLAHLSIGQEAVAVGVCYALEPDDYITSNHRGHGHCLAKGGSVDKMFAELLGKEDGYCHGKGGSMHIANPDSGNLGANAIVGGSAGIATGAAFSAKQRGTKQVSVCFFGEGSLGEGLLYEVMNMAQLWQLPIIYVCENNLYNEYTPYAEATAGKLIDRPKAFGIHVEEVDGQDVMVVYETMMRLVNQCRHGEGPAFLLCNTYRYHGHHVGDIDRAYYRSKEEELEWRTHRDPIQLFVNKLIQFGIAEKDLIEQIQAEAKAEIDTSAEYAIHAPYPDLKEVDQHVYV